MVISENWLNLLDVVRFSIRIDFSDIVRMDRIGSTDPYIFIILNRIDCPLNLNDIESGRLALNLNHMGSNRIGNNDTI
jgi:hypothetical protein